MFSLYQVYLSMTIEQNVNSYQNDGMRSTTNVLIGIQTPSGIVHAWKRQDGLKLTSKNS